MKATIWFRAANDDQISILIEPVIKHGLHSIKVQRMNSTGKQIIGISRFHVDSEEEAFEFFGALIVGRGQPMEYFLKTVHYALYCRNNLEELLK